MLRKKARAKSCLGLESCEKCLVYLSPLPFWKCTTFLSQKKAGKWRSKGQGLLIVKKSQNNWGVAKTFFIPSLSREHTTIKLLAQKASKKLQVIPSAVSFRNAALMRLDSNIDWWTGSQKNKIRLTQPVLMNCQKLLRNVLPDFS